METIMVRIEKKLKKELQIIAIREEKSLSDVIGELYEYKMSMVQKRIDKATD